MIILVIMTFVCLYNHTNKQSSDEHHELKDETCLTISKINHVKKESSEIQTFLWSSPCGCCTFSNSITSWERRLLINKDLSDVKKSLNLCYVLLYISIINWRYLYCPALKPWTDKGILWTRNDTNWTFLCVYTVIVCHLLVYHHSAFNVMTWAMLIPFQLPPADRHFEYRLYLTLHYFLLLFSPFVNLE